MPYSLFPKHAALLVCQAYVSIRTIPDLLFFVVQVGKDTQAAEHCDHLKVVIRETVFDGPPRLLLGGLSACVNLTVLEVIVPPRFTGTLLPDITFPNLFTFKTTMRHSLVSSFLKQNRAITELDLRSRCPHPRCCPIGRHSDALKDLHCDISCLPTIAKRAELRRVTATNNGELSGTDERDAWLDVAPHLQAVEKLDVRDCSSSICVLEAVCTSATQINDLRVVESSVGTISSQ